MAEQMNREFLEREIRKLSSRVVLLRFLQVIVVVNTVFMVLDLISREAASNVTIGFIIALVMAFVATAEVLMHRFKERVAKAKGVLASLGTGR